MWPIAGRARICQVPENTYLRAVLGRLPTHGSGLGTLFVPKVLYGIFTNIVSVQIFAKTKNEKTMTSVKSLLPASDTTPILDSITHGIRLISMKLPSVVFGRWICHGCRGWIEQYARTLTINNRGIIHRFVMSMPSYTVNQLLQFTTVYRRWYVIYTRSYMSR